MCLQVDRWLLKFVTTEYDILAIAGPLDRLLSIVYNMTLSAGERLRDMPEDISDVLEVRDLRTYFHLPEGTLKAVDGVDLTIAPHETVGVIGESGSGKSVTAQSILQIVPPPGAIETGENDSCGAKTASAIDIGKLDPRSRRNPRHSWRRSLDGIPGADDQPVARPYDRRANRRSYLGFILKTTRKKPSSWRLDMINRVGISNPKQRFDEYPHQLSGGMRQRAMIAMALSCSPSLLIADEPTTALDVTVQAQILELMKELQAQFGMAIMYITHDLGVIAEIADEVNVMYLGRVVERASTVELFKNPRHPYTQRLLKSIPRLGRSWTGASRRHSRECAGADESAGSMRLRLALR